MTVAMSGCDTPPTPGEKSSDHSYASVITSSEDKTSSIASDLSSEPATSEAASSDPSSEPVSSEVSSDGHVHDYTAATCIAPKTCNICGKTSGGVGGHNFSGDSCTVCGKAKPDNADDTMVWIPTKGGTKYHSYAGCSGMKSPDQVTQSQAESLGFSPCKKCH